MPSLPSREIEQWFDIDRHIDAEFCAQYIDLMKQNSRDSIDLRVEIWLKTTSVDRRVTFYEKNDAANYIAEHWAGIEEVAITYYSGPLVFMLINHQHHYLRARVQDTSGSPAESLFKLLKDSLSLVPSLPHPYKYRRSSIEFEIGHWSPKYFAAGVSAIAELIGPNPYLENAYVKSFEGDIERLTPFFDIPVFLGSLDRRASTFGEVSVQLRARSTTVGIGVPTDHKRLRIRTSLPPEQVDVLIEAWPSELRLKQVRAVDSGNYFTGTESSAKEESFWVKFGLPIIVAFITAFSVTSLVTLKKAIWPDNKLAIVSPVSESGRAIWHNSELEVNWYLEPNQPSLRSIQKHALATVKLTDSLGHSREITQEPPVNFDVTAGPYILTVDAPDIPVTRLSVLVEKPLQERKSPDVAK